MGHRHDSDAAADTKADASVTLMPLVNHERVLEMIDLICEGEPAAFGRWVDFLDADLAKFAALLSIAGTTESNLKIFDAAHALKGTCLNLGAPALGALFAELERHAKQSEWEALLLRYGESRELEAQSTHLLREVAANSGGGG